MENKILAVKCCEKREFTEKIWNSMPPDKYGWKIPAETPEEVKAMFKKQNEKFWPSATSKK